MHDHHEEWNEAGDLEDGAERVWRTDLLEEAYAQSDADDESTLLAGEATAAAIGSLMVFHQASDSLVLSNSLSDFVHLI